MGRPPDDQARRMTPNLGARRWAWRALSSAIAGGGLTAAGLGPVSTGALAAETWKTEPEGTGTTPTETTPSETTSTSSTPPTTTSTPTASTPAPAPTTTSTPAPAASSPSASSGDTEVKAPLKPKAKGPAVVLQRRQKVTASKPGSATTPTQPASTTNGAQSPANNNVAVAPQVIAAQEEALAAELAGSAASAQALSFYRIPLFLLPIYQAASVQYGVP